ncbi:biotin-dependent carboxyltransferase family protein [Pseudomonas karstica]|uniref:5-oxoprolinase subunit C family protein n=1 Tax=Pseudomonas karstica TaxID=1055468 RepID=UPI0012BA11FB
MIEILSTGALNSIQDLGRFGYLNIGVAQSGAMDTLALRVGNLVLGNTPECAALEIAMFPFKLRFLTPQVFTIVGAECRMQLSGIPLAPQWVCDAKAGDTLVVEPPEKGSRVYVCFAGGLDVEPVMGSRSTDLKSALGGLDGRGLKRGDTIATFQTSQPPFKGGVCAPSAVSMGSTQIRLTPGAEYSQFSEHALAQFFHSEWKVTQESNRMGIRLSGPVITPRNKMEMLSHGILPGTVQVPPSGQPIVQMADANTCGGYPKIANVIDADIPRLAQLPVDSVFRFTLVTHEQALEAQTEVDASLERLHKAIAVGSRSLF